MPFRTLMIIGAALWAAFSSVQPAAAEAVCFPSFAHAMAAITAHSGVEDVIGRGFDNSGRYPVLLTEGASGNWSLILRTPDGAACIIAGGASFDVFAKTMPWRNRSPGT